jgi:predicted phosphodiesterase
MSVLVISDLHLDRWLMADRDPFLALPADLLASVKGLIVAGDLSNKPKVWWPHMIGFLTQYVPAERVYLVPGNHDYYNHVIDGDDRLAEICAGAGVSYAQKAAIVIGYTRFLCCTLWTDFALHGNPVWAMMDAEQLLNDYRYIRLSGAGFRRIRASDTALIHTDHRLWLETQLATPFEGSTVVVTHHCPHPNLIAEQRNNLDPAYGSNLLHLIEAFQPQAWLFGHTHWHVEAWVGQTLVRNVSLGYPYQVESGRVAGILLRGLVEAGA